MHTLLNYNPLQSHFQRSLLFVGAHFVIVTFLTHKTFQNTSACTIFFFFNGALSDIFSAESPLFPLHSERGHKQADRGSGRDHSGPGGDFWRHRVGNRVSTS